MKTFKRTLSCFLALLMIFGSFSVLSYAAFGDGSEKSITVETKFFVDGVETDTVQAGDTVKARVYIATDFKIATTTLFWVYPLDFFKLDTSVLTSNGGNAYDVVGALNSSETSIAATANLGGFMVHQEGFVLDSMSDADNLVYEGYLTEDYFDDKGWISFTIDSGTPVVLTTDNGNEDKDDDHFAEFTFTVKDDATGEGYFYVPEESVMNTTGQDYGFTAIQRAKSDTQFMVVYDDFAYVRAYDLALNDTNTVKLGSGEVTPTEYNITYAYEGDIPDGYKEPEAIKAVTGTEVTEPEVEIPEGYELTWTMSGDVDGKVGTEDVTMTGTWSLATYTIKYYLSEEDQEAGKVYKEVPYEYTAPIADFAPAAEDILGKEFVGWDIDIPMSMPANNLEAVAMLNDIEYMVYFYNEEGDVIDSATLVKYYNETVAESDAPDMSEIEGYTFNGWVDADGEAIGFPVTVTDDVHIYSNCTINTYKFTYYITYVGEDSEENVVHETFDVKYGEEIPAPSKAPVLEGHSFVMWDMSYEGTSMPAEDTYDVAVWDANPYTATFTSVNGANAGTFAGGLTEMTVPDVLYGDEITLDEEPVLAGFTFQGWTDVEGGTTPLTKLVMDAEGKTFYPVFTANAEADYSVEIYLMGTDGKYADTASKTETGTGTIGVEVKVAHADYAQDAWFSEDAAAANETTAVIAADGSTTFKLYYARAKYEVTVDNAKVAEVYYGGTYNAPAAPAVGEGLTFAGWKAGDGKVYEAGEAITVTGALTLTATTTQNEYDVIFMINGNTFASGKAAYGSDIEMDAPADEYIPAGYKYLGWSTDGKTVITDLGTVTVGGNTFYAVLEAKTDVVYEIHKIYQNTTGGWDNPVITEEKGTTDTTATLNAADLKEEGFTLDTENSVLSANINGDGSTDLIVRYLRNRVSVTINGDQEYYYYDEEINAENPSKEGNDFGGWVDEDGNTVTFPMKAPAEDIVITPVWNVKSYTVSYEDEDGTVLKAAETVEYGSTLTAPTLEDKEGMNFVGWFAKETGEAMPATMPAKNVVYVATWTESTNTQYTIEVYMMDTNGDYSMSAATVAFGTTGSKQTIVPGAITGCSVDTAKSVLNGTVAADGSLVLKVYYARNLHTVTWLAADGSTIATENVYYGAAINEADAPAAETGKTFAGWAPAVPATMPDEDLEFTATWADAVYTITYVINGKAEAPVEYVYGATVVPHEEPEVDGMTFKGWTPGIPTTMPAENLIIVAEFEASVYKVTFLDADGEVWDVKNVQYGDEIVLPTTEPTKDYYVFTGWANVPEKMPAENITIYPEFERVPVMLVAQEGSTTVIDRENNIITGLGYRLREGTFDSKYLDVVGDGYFTVTPVEGTTNWYGTGAAIELYDNETGTLLETYYVVVYGDINGDGSVSAADDSIAEDEAFGITEWSWEQTWVDGALVDNSEYDYLKKLAADLDKDGDVDSSDVSNISNTSIGITAIDQTTGTVDR